MGGGNGYVLFCFVLFCFVCSTMDPLGYLFAGVCIVCLCVYVGIVSCIHDDEYGAPPRTWGTIDLTKGVITPSVGLLLE